MPAYIALLRAVNVGRRQTPMARVRAVLEAGGFTEVATIIQTGNVRVVTPMRSPAAVADRVAEVLGAEFGFDVPAIVRRPAQLPTLVAAVEALPDPYPGGRSYVAFLDRVPAAGTADTLAGWSREGETAYLLDDHIVLRLGVSFHEAKITGARIERLGVVATARDMTVVRRLATEWGS